MGKIGKLGCSIGVASLVLVVACGPAATKKSRQDQPVTEGTAEEPGAEAESAESNPSTQEGSEAQESSSAERDPGERSSQDSTDEPEDLPDPSARFDLGTMPESSTDNEIRPCEVDFLFVVDNSGSMGIKQESLTRSVPGFIESMMNSTEMEKDFHIGVVTTDESPGNIPNCAFTGGLVVQTRNFDEVRHCGPYKNGLSFMTQADDLDKRFGCAAKPGISGNTEEKPIDAIRGALNPENSGKGRCNESFLRKDGLLVVVLITDEDDREDLGGSKGTPEQWHAELLAAKGGDEKKLVVLSIVVPPKPNACKPGDLLAKETKKLNAFTKKFGERGFVADVCEDDYGPTFDKAIGIIDFACGELNPPPE